MEYIKYQVYLPAGKENNTLDAPVALINDEDEPVTTESASISGIVFYDANGNTQIDPEDAGVPGVVASLMNKYSDNPSYIITDPGGRFKFDNIQSGEYRLEFYNIPEDYKRMAGEAGPTGPTGATGPAGKYLFEYIKFVAENKQYVYPNYRFMIEKVVKNGEKLLLKPYKNYLALDAGIYMICYTATVGSSFEKNSITGELFLNLNDEKINESSCVKTLYKGQIDTLSVSIILEIRELWCRVELINGFSHPLTAFVTRITICRIGDLM